MRALLFFKFVFYNVLPAFFHIYNPAMTGNAASIKNEADMLIAFIIKPLTNGKTAPPRLIPRFIKLIIVPVVSRFSANAAFIIPG
jgi:hypothetical protein